MAKTQTTLEGGAKPTDWIKIEPLGGGANPNGMYNNPMYSEGKPDTTMVNPKIKTLKTPEQQALEANEQIKNLKFDYKSLAMTSIVPLGLAYYSYNEKFSLTKGVTVIVVGSVVAFYGAIMLSGKKFV
jgi:hypothetical protein